MNFLDLSLIFFILLEIGNVFALYFKPTLKQANGVGMFKSYELTKSQNETHNLVTYLIYWIAGSKVIFLSLLIVILFFGNDQLKMISTIVLVLSIGTFYWKMYPLIKKMDKENEIDPKGYSKTLGLMILVFMLVLSLGVIINFWSN